jgi:putative tryptophan/tyrosine transport system substrate-binding protein
MLPVAAALLCLVLLASPLAGEAQPIGTLHRIGVLTAGGVSTERSASFDAFRQSLGALGYAEGRNLAIEYRYAEGDLERLPALAADLVARGVAVIVTVSTPAAQAAKRATSTIPIVMATAGDPVGTGLVASLAQPGGNVTGLSLLSTDITAKRLELLRELIPKSTRFAFLGNSTIAPEMRGFRESEAAARALGATIEFMEARDLGEFDAAFAAARRKGVEAVIVTESTRNTEQRERIVQLAARHRVPAMYGRREFVDAGGLLSYGPSYVEFFRRAAVYVDKILKGARPADLPVEQPSRIELIVNLKAATALGLTVPPPLLLRADEVIACPDKAGPPGRC